MSRPTRDETWLAVARVVARRSTCLRRAVGCVLVDRHGDVLGLGHNGVASGEPHCNEEHRFPDGRLISNEFVNACPGAHASSGADLDGCHALHAEQNALLRCRDVHAIDTCYVTTAPCLTCTKLLMGTSCHHVVFLEPYPQAAAAEALWLRREAARKQQKDLTWTQLYGRPDLLDEPVWTWRQAGTAGPG